MHLSLHNNFPTDMCRYMHIYKIYVYIIVSFILHFIQNLAQFSSEILCIFTAKHCVIHTTLHAQQTITITITVGSEKPRQLAAARINNK